MADEQPLMVTERAQREAVALLQRAAMDGEIAPDEAERRIGLVWKAVTERDLWRATGGRAGSPKRADSRERWRTAAAVAGMIVFAVLGVAAFLGIAIAVS